MEMGQSMEQLQELLYRHLIINSDEWKKGISISFSWPTEYENESPQNNYFL